MSSNQRRNAVCIVGGGFVNKGAEAMVLTVADAVRHNLVGTDIYVRMRRPDLEQMEPHDLRPWEQDAATGIMARLRHKTREIGMFYRCGAFIDVGGYQFGDPWGRESAQRKAQMFRRSARFGKLVFFMPQAWGPFTVPGMDSAIRSIVNTATLCCVRDVTSMKAMGKIVGANHPKIRFAHDIAWNFRGLDPSVGRGLVQEAGLAVEKPSLLVCVTPNRQIYKRSHGVGSDNEYIAFLRRIVEHLCREHSASVVLLGHELLADNSRSMDDRTLCQCLLSSIDKSLPVIHVDKVLSAAEIKSVIGGCDLLLSSRYHALIAALSQQIPVVAIGWSHKYEELLTEVGLGSNAISVSPAIDEASHKIALIIERLPEIRAALGLKVPAIQQNAQDVVNDVLRYIRERFENQRT